jgi:hypothetical protein|tara:strand:+ start:739 stop:1068 length:330 start_codon:yes stop_codon:yes gene_type:complete
MIELSIYSDDIRDMDERLDRAFDIKNGWGSEAVTDDNKMVLDNLNKYPQGSVHAVIQMQQCQISDQQHKIDTLIKHIKQLDKTVHEITDCLDSAAKNIFSIGMQTGNKK